MTMKGSDFRLITYPPNYDELRECQNIPLSYEFYWYPSKNLFEISSMEEEYRKSSSFRRYINVVDSRVTCAPPTIQCRDDSVIHEIDRSMEKNSIGLAQDLMV